MPNLGSGLFTRAVLFITIIAASTLLSCVNVEDKFFKRFSLSDDLEEGVPVPVFTLTFGTPFSMGPKNVVVKGEIEGTGPFPDTATWEVCLYNASASLVQMQTFSTKVNREGQILATHVQWDPFTADVNFFVVIKATVWGTNVPAGTMIKFGGQITPRLTF